MAESMAWQFVDTGILVYAHDVSAGSKHGIAKQLVENLWESGEGCVCTKVLEEFYLTVRRGVPEPMYTVDAQRVVEALAHWRVYQPDAGDILAAVALRRRFRLEFRDAMIFRSAQRLGCSILWTETIQHGWVHEGIEVRNPFGGILGA